MKLTVGLSAAFLAVTLAGCADLTPLQADLKDLHAQVSQLQTSLGAVKTSANNAASSAAAAQRAAVAAKASAQQALDLANADEKKIDDTNEKLDRMFKRHLSK
jgi:murein lipoprotein